MAISQAVVSRVRVLAITHILVGALLIIFGMAEVVYQTFFDMFTFFGFGTGIWMCIAGGLGIPASTPQGTQRRNCFAGIFLGFAITSAVFGGIAIIVYSISMAGTGCQDFCRDNYSCSGRYGTVRSPYSYDTKMALTAVIFSLGVIEFGTGIWVSICLCVMKPCCINLEERQPLFNSVRG